MEFFTSYHAKAAQLHKEGYFVVNISVMFPKFAKIEHYDVPSFLVLAPRKDMLKMSQENYDKAFAKILSEFSPSEIVKQLGQRAFLAGKEKIVLLCYEKNRCECHRSVVGDWIEKGTGNTVKEVLWDSDKPKPKPAPQLALF